MTAAERERIVAEARAYSRRRRQEQELTPGIEDEALVQWLADLLAEHRRRVA